MGVDEQPKMHIYAIRWVHKKTSGRGRVAVRLVGGVGQCPEGLSHDDFVFCGKVTKNNLMP